MQVDNERVRVTEWRFAPGAETGEHVHADGLRGGAARAMVALKLVVAAGRGKLRRPEARRLATARKAGVHHNVINANAFEFAFVEIELKKLKTVIAAQAGIHATMPRRLL